MSWRQQFSRVPLCTLMTGIGLAVGLIVPTVFEWTGKPAARSRHTAMDRAALVVIVVTLLVAAIFWFVNRPKELADETPPARASRPVQFGIRHILIAMTLVAVLIAGLPLFNSILAPWAVINMAAGLLVWSLFLGPTVRSRFAALLAAMFLPFFWVISFSKPFGHVSGMHSAIAFGPGLVPAMLLRLGHTDESTWIAATFVILELAFGFYLARRTGGLFITIYIVLLLVISAGTSLLFHALYRM